jgi:hypothetical protein
MPHLSGGQLYLLQVENPRLQRLISHYWNIAVRDLLEGDDATLLQFRGWTVLGLPFETDPDVVLDFWLSTDFDFQEVYEP